MPKTLQNPNYTSLKAFKRLLNSKISSIPLTSCNQEEKKFVLGLFHHPNNSLSNSNCTMKVKTSIHIDKRVKTE